MMERTPLFWAVFGADVSRRAGKRQAGWRHGGGGAGAWWDDAVKSAWSVADNADHHYRGLVERGALPDACPIHAAAPEVLQDEEPEP